jgi:hypothetical protein
MASVDMSNTTNNTIIIMPASVPAANVAPSSGAFAAAKQPALSNDQLEVLRFLIQLNDLFSSANAAAKPASTATVPKQPTLNREPMTLEFSLVDDPHLKASVKRQDGKDVVNNNIIDDIMGSAAPGKYTDLYNADKIDLRMGVKAWPGDPSKPTPNGLTPTVIDEIGVTVNGKKVAIDESGKVFVDGVQQKDKTTVELGNGASVKIDGTQITLKSKNAEFVFDAITNNENATGSPIKYLNISSGKITDDGKNNGPGGVLAGIMKAEREGKAFVNDPSAAKYQVTELFDDSQNIKRKENAKPLKPDEMSVMLDYLLQTMMLANQPQAQGPLASMANSLKTLDTLMELSQSVKSPQMKAVLDRAMERVMERMMVDMEMNLAMSALASNPMLMPGLGGLGGLSGLSGLGGLSGLSGLGGLSGLSGLGGLSSLGGVNLPLSLTSSTSTVEEEEEEEEKAA